MPCYYIVNNRLTVYLLVDRIALMKTLDVQQQIIDVVLKPSPKLKAIAPLVIAKWVGVKRF